MCMEPSYTTRELSIGAVLKGRMVSLGSTENSGLFMEVATERIG